MIGLDTNVLLRLGDDDEPFQRDRVRALVRTRGVGGCFVNAIVLSAYAWTLGRAYKLPRGAIADRLMLLIESSDFVIANPAEAQRAVHRFRDGAADFADYFLAEINAAAGCTTTATFDRDALKSGEPFSPVPTLS